MADDPQLGEINRKLDDFRRDVRDDFQTINVQLAQYVLREVYIAERTALAERVSRLEAVREADRQTVRNAVLAAIGSVAASIIVGVVMAILTKGGH